MGGRIYAADIIWVGMGIILSRFHQPIYWHTAKFTHSSAIGLDHRSVLGTLVGDKAPTVVDGGDETWRELLNFR